MFYSLVQTIVCVLLIQGGLYALHLNGPGGSSNGVSGGSSIGGGGGGVIPPANLGGSGAAQLNTAANTNQMLNILSATQHAQHLHAGGSGSGSGGGGGGSSGSLAHAFSKSTVGPLDSAGRLSQELADMAQLERERLMLLGLAKQTAAASGGTGHHGRPIITGRIQMSPIEEMDSDYPALVLQQARGPMYGSIVKQPAAVEDEYADEEGEYESDRLDNGARRRPEKYEYGRIVQPSDREEYEQSHHADALDELIEAEPEIDDMLTDLESYQYLDELSPSEHRGMWGEVQPAYGIAGGTTRPHHLNDGFPLLLNPYRTLEELEENPPHTLQEIFEKEHHSGGLKEHRTQAHDQQQQQQQHQSHHQTQQQQLSFSEGIKHRKGGFGARGSAAGYNSHLQQKWQRKRSQQQQQQRQMQQWQRSIFGQQQQQQSRLHHFGSQSEPQRTTKLSLANSEATATRHIQPNSSNNNNNLASALNILTPQKQSSSTSLLSASGAAIKSEPQQQNIQEQKTMQRRVGNENVVDNASSTAALAKANGVKFKAQKQQQKQQQTPLQKQESYLHPNHKRSSSVVGGGGGGGNSMSAAAANNGYSSIASQLMLRTARGQRQYDVPQIECPAAMDGMERFACPTPDLQGRYRCIDDHVLCDGFIDCPEGEDEDRRSCMFYKTVKAHLDVLADALLRWARGR